VLPLQEIVGSIRKWRNVYVHWKAKVIRIEDDKAVVEVTGIDYKTHNNRMTLERWNKDELRERGFPI
jgi:thioredoxin reductase